ncbi:MAG: FHA domain-containing protein [Pyrinomonadaceae bacterium]
MKLVLAEERNGQRRPERTFDLATVRMGRDPAECQVVFDQTEWPMVSRKHAEFRLQGHACLIVDTNSKFGTFLDGRRVTEPMEIRAGSRVQLGSGGPLLHVLHIELTTQGQPPAFNTNDMNARERAQAGWQAGQGAAVAAPPQTPVQKAAPPPAPQIQTPAPTPTAPPPVVELVNVATGKLERITIKKDVTKLGRDTEMDIVLDASTAVVSRRHAQIERRQDQYVIIDQASFNGTLVNEHRITTPTPLYDGDRIQLGMGGPILRFVDPAHPAPAGAQFAGQRAVSSAGIPQVVKPALPVEGRLAEVAGLHTMVLKRDSGGPKPEKGAISQQRELLMQRPFDGKQQLTIGRAPDNDLHLDGLLISNHHARVVLAGGTVLIEDVGSTNGVYVNGERITGRRSIQMSDLVQVGPFLLQADAAQGVAVFDTRAKTRIDAIDITKIVSNRSGGGKIKLLDDVDLTIQPNEFVGLLGPSGAGKSTLMDSLNGMRPATSGHVLINNLDLYQHLDSLKQSIGYVPQDDIIHRELTVYRTLYYVARLRLSRDVSAKEIDQIVGEVLDVTGLSERRDVPVAQLSGGQRKRVSIAVELITKPSVIFLDEPTSGLDPATEEKIMRLFRQIAESGRTVILTTHAMENVRLFDKIVVLMRGKLVFYGTPQEALAHLKAENFKDLYDKLEAPVDERVAKMGRLPPTATKEHKLAYKRQKEQIADEVAEEWKQRFQRTETYKQNIVKPLEGVRPDAQSASVAKRRRSITDAIRQWATLARRYLEVLSRDRFNLLILFGQSPIIAIMTYLVVAHDAPRDFPFFILALVAIWFGTSVAAREIIRERAVYNRERMVNLGIFPYVCSKLFVLSLIVGFQCLLLFGSLKFLDLVGLMKFPGSYLGIPQLFVMILTGMVGIALGLFVSAVVKTSEMATSLVPLILIPQILFSGLIGVPTGVSRAVGAVMPATWSFDEIKRLAPVDTLREEGSNPKGETQGRGLYKHIEDLNDKNIVKARKDVERFKNDADEAVKNYEKKMNDYMRDAPRDPSLRKPERPTPGAAPDVPVPVKVTKDLSNYVDFLHPWGGSMLDPIILIIMFFGLIIASIIALKTQDIR